jgi:hypothetical protein
MVSKTVAVYFKPKTAILDKYVKASSKFQKTKEYKFSCTFAKTV